MPKKWPAFPELMDAEVTKFCAMRERTPAEIHAFKDGLRQGQRVSLNLVYGNDFPIQDRRYLLKDQIQLERVLRIIGAIPPEPATPSEEK